MKEQFNKLLSFLKIKRSSVKKRKSFSKTIKNVVNKNCKIPMTISLAGLMKSSSEKSNTLTSLKSISTIKSSENVLKEVKTSSNIKPKSNKSFDIKPESIEKRSNIEPKRSKSFNIKPEPTGISIKLYFLRKTQNKNWIYEP